MSVLKDSFSRAEMETALHWLDRAIGQSEILADLIPIHMVSYGGFLSVCLFDNRTSTKDIDVLLPSNVRDSDVHRNELARLVEGVAGELDYMPDWINDDLKLFVPIEQRQKLLEDSIEQGTVAFEGDNLVIWAGLWEFGLETKLYRLHTNESQTPLAQTRYNNDLSDAVNLVHRLKGSSAHPLDKSWVKGLARFGPNPSFENEVEKVSQEYMARYGTQGIAELVWDGTEEKHKYLNSAGEWVFYE
ncbi:hypothetical protein B0J18DRAFT_478828 [Chaetomium sp. MPI-SDFR-AT-0129]|nr:hypothetical protein B0J18DRAFT_478828 [Chaetomium sp. MPI-SDFR-AT-0129]